MIILIDFKRCKGKLLCIYLSLFGYFLAHILTNKLTFDFCNTSSTFLTIFETRNGSEIRISMALNKLFKDLSIQDYITLGYLYLVIIGMINIQIYYSSFNINIFDYAAITDILLAPINMLMLNPKASILLLIIIGFITFLMKFGFQLINKILANISSKLGRDQFQVPYNAFVIFLLLFSILFLDLSSKMADAMSSIVKQKKYKPNSTLTFNDNVQKNVFSIATTSSYIFYVEEGGDKVTISPIASNIKAIKRIPYK
jgi:hypothetical protein